MDVGQLAQHNQRYAKVIAKLKAQVGEVTAVSLEKDVIIEEQRENMASMQTANEALANRVRELQEKYEPKPPPDEGDRAANE